MNSSIELFRHECSNGNLASVQFVVQEQKLFMRQDILNDGLMIATENEHLNIVRFLFLKGARRHRKAFYCSCAYGWLEIVKFLFSQDYDLDDALQHACENGHIDVIHFLLEKGADDFERALNYACEGGHFDIANFFISKIQNNGEQIDWNNNLEWACEGGCFKLVKLIVAKLEEIGQFGINSVNNGMKYACGKGHTKIVKFMIKKERSLLPLLRNCYGYQIQEPIINYQQGLAHACCGGHLHIAKLMVKKGRSSVPQLGESSSTSLLQETAKPASEWNEAIECCRINDVDLHKFLILCRKNEGDKEKKIVWKFAELTNKNILNTLTTREMKMYFSLFFLADDFKCLIRTKLCHQSLFYVSMPTQNVFPVLKRMISP